MDRIKQPMAAVGGELGALIHFGLYFAWVVIFYLAIIHTIPVHSLYASTQGLTHFCNTVVYPRLNGDMGTLANVNTLDDAVLWTESMMKAVLTEESYRAVDKEDIGKETRTDDEHLMLLRVHRLINSIIVVQRRVQETDCSYDAMKPLYHHCHETLDDHEVTSGRLILDNGDRVVPYNADKGGFAVEMPLDKEVALPEIEKLRTDGFWDRATRQFTVAFAFHNSPGHYTGNCEVKFNMSPYGLIEHEIDISFLRMKPYSEETDGWLLLTLQGVALAGVLYLLSMNVIYFSRQPHSRWKLAFCLRPWSLMDIMMYYLLIMSIWNWVSYLNSPLRESFSFTARHYQNLGAMAATYNQVCLLQSMALLVAVVRMIEFFERFKRLKFIVDVLSRSSENVAWFMIIFVTLFVGFALSGHVLFGIQDPNFGSAEASGRTLAIWFVALGGGHENLFNMAGGDVFLLLFMATMMILVFNFFVTFIMGAYDQVVNEDSEEDVEPPGKPFNYLVADWICDRLGVSPYEDDPYSYDYTFNKI
jgi:hypothetical protein